MKYHNLYKGSVLDVKGKDYSPLRNEKRAVKMALVVILLLTIATLAHYVYALLVISNL